MNQTQGTPNPVRSGPRPLHPPNDEISIHGGEYFPHNWKIYHPVFGDDDIAAYRYSLGVDPEDRESGPQNPADDIAADSNITFHKVSEVEGLVREQETYRNNLQRTPEADQSQSNLAEIKTAGDILILVFPGLTSYGEFFLNRLHFNQDWLRDGVVRRGVSLIAHHTNAKLTIFANVPYLVQQSSSSTGKEPKISISSARATYTVFNDTIAMFFSEEPTKRPILPFYPGQHRACSIHLMAHMLSTIFQFQAREILTNIGERIERYEDLVLDSEPGTIPKEAPAMRRDITVDLLRVLRVVKEQLQAVKDLRELFENAQGYQLKTKESFFKNTIILPVWGSEHIDLILQALEWVISERQSYLQKFEDMKKDFGTDTGTQLLGNLQDEMKNQSVTMSWFTLVNYLFLPLSFFTQYYALEFAKVTFAVQFWKVTAPVTAFFLLGIVNIIFYKKLLGKEEGPRKFTRQMRTLMNQTGSWIEQMAEHMLTAVAWKVWVLIIKLPEWQMEIGTVAHQRLGRSRTNQMEAGTN